jgi:uncharacterized membrane protein
MVPLIGLLFVMALIVCWICIGITEYLEKVPWIPRVFVLVSLLLSCLVGFVMLASAAILTLSGIAILVAGVFH